MRVRFTGGLYVESGKVTFNTLTRNQGDDVIGGLGHSTLKCFMCGSLPGLCRAFLTKGGG